MNKGPDGLKGKPARNWRGVCRIAGPVSCRFTTVGLLRLLLAVAGPMCGGRTAAH